MTGVRLLLLHPEVAMRDCQHCQKWLYDEKTGRVEQRAGKDVLRPGTPTPCRFPKGCPKGTPEKQLSLTPKNEMAYQHYKECKAVGAFPDDPIVRRNAAMIRAVEDSVATTKNDVLMERMGLLGVVASMFAVGKKDG